ncbi:hypothetical protein SAMN05414139_09428 [Burkholderia sp. D7]|nr:hypothetical protein SAMN05414139_09428 [Burkholderia sp. D7]
MGKLKDIDGSFNGRHFDREIIVLCVRWYLRYKLSFRDLTEMMAERGLSLAHTTQRHLCTFDLDDGSFRSLRVLRKVIFPLACAICTTTGFIINCFPNHLA